MTKVATHIPPDPEGMNDSRATWAALAVTAFQHATGTDDKDALSDLLADLMHWADRSKFHFEAALVRAQDHYQAETSGNPTFASHQPIVIEVRGGVVQDVLNVPSGYRFEIKDYDDLAASETDDGRKS